MACLAVVFDQFFAVSCWMVFRQPVTVLSDSDTLEPGSAHTALLGGPTLRGVGHRNVFPTACNSQATRIPATPDPWIVLSTIVAWLPEKIMAMGGRPPSRDSSLRSTVTVQPA